MFMDFNDHNNGGGGSGGGSNVPVEARFWGPLHVDKFIKARLEGRPLIWTDIYPLIGILMMQQFFNPERDYLPAHCTSVTMTRGDMKGSYFFGEPAALEDVLKTANRQCPDTDPDDIDLAFANGQNYILAGDLDIAQMSSHSWGLYSHSPQYRRRII